jgi:hypothetical protein
VLFYRRIVTGDPAREQRMNVASEPEELVLSHRCPEPAEIVGFYVEDFGDLSHSGRELRLHDGEKFHYLVYTDLAFVWFFPAGGG